MDNKNIKPALPCIFNCLDDFKNSLFINYIFSNTNNMLQGDRECHSAPQGSETMREAQEEKIRLEREKGENDE